MEHSRTLSNQQMSPLSILQPSPSPSPQRSLSAARSWEEVHRGWTVALEATYSLERHLRPVQGTSRPQLPILMGTRKGEVVLPTPWGSKSFSQPWATRPGPDLAHREASVWNSCSPRHWLHIPAPPRWKGPHHYSIWCHPPISIGKQLPSRTSILC